MKRKVSKRPYFLWDYDLTEADVRKKLKEDDEYTRRWLIGRIVSHAHFRDVFNYLTIKEILEIWPRLRIRPQIKQAWENAFKVWGYHVTTEK